MMADRCGHGEGEHDQRDMTVPAMPRPGFVVVEPQFVLGGFEAVLDCPSVALDPGEGFDGGSLWAPSCEV